MVETIVFPAIGFPATMVAKLSRDGWWEGIESTATGFAGVVGLHVLMEASRSGGGSRAMAMAVALWPRIAEEAAWYNKWRE